MKKTKKFHILLLLLTGLPVVFCQAQSSALSWPDSLNTTQGIQYLSEREKAVILEMNKIRTNPKKYAVYLKEERKYYQGYDIIKGDVIIETSEGVAAIDECIAYLENATPVGILYPEKCLTHAATLQAKDQSKSGNVGHEGNNGSKMRDRIIKYCGETYTRIAENINYGEQEGRAIVMQLMIDDGVPSRGHRTTLMSDRYVSCGVSIHTHPVYRHVCVIDYATFRE